MMELEAICDRIEAAARGAGSYILSQQQGITAADVETKSLNSFVTAVDKASEAMIADSLRAVLPDAGFVAEEGTGGGKREVRNWIIDPLDGTTNYIHGLPSWCVSIALQDGASVVAGVVYDPNLDECFRATRGGGARLNGRPIRVSKAARLSDTLLATGFPYHDYGRMKEYLALFEHLMQHTHGLRRWGSAAIDLAWTACGRFDGFYEYGLNAWDVAAGALLVQEAGGRVTAFREGNDFIFGAEIIASNGEIHGELSGAVQRFFG